MFRFVFGALGRWLRHEETALNDKNGALNEMGGTVSPFSLRGCSEEKAVCELGSRSWTDTIAARALILDLQTSRRAGSKFLLDISHSEAMVFLL